MSPWLRFAFLIPLVAVISFIPITTEAEPSCEWSQGFHLAGFDGDVLASAVFDDGSGPVLVVGGRFEHIHERVVKRLAQWDGSQWQPLGDGLPGAVFALQVYDDGSGEALYAGGYFGSVGESNAGYIAKWDGTSWSPVGGGMDGGVNALAIYQEGDDEVLIAGGLFNQAGSVAAQKVAKWDGQSWSSLGATFNQGGSIQSITPWLGTFVIGGDFGYLNGQEVNNAAYYSGNGQWTAMAGGTSSTVTSLEVFDDGNGPKVYAAGYFSQAGGATVNHVARWDLFTWTSLGLGTAGSIQAMKTLDLGQGPQLYVAGKLKEVDGNPSDNIAHWNGSSWQSLESNLMAVPQVLFSHDLGEGPFLFAGGSFSIPGGIHNLAVWNGDLWDSFDGLSERGFGLDGLVRASTVFDDGTGTALYISGDFALGGNDDTARLAKWKGSTWTALAIPSPPSNVRAIIGFDDGNGPALYVAGDIESSSSGPIEGLAKWDGKTWSPLGEGIEGDVYALEVFDDGNGPALYVGGLFEALDGSGAKDTAKWDGSTWTALGSGADSSVLDFVAFDDGEGAKLFAAGHFEEIDGAPADHIAYWDGTAWNALGSGELNGSIYTLEIFDDGSGPALYAAGSFYFDFSTLEILGRVAKWDGSQWIGLGLNNSIISSERVLDLQVFDDGSGPTLYASGHFYFSKGEVVNHIARWNGNDWDSLGTGLESASPGSIYGYTLGVYDDGIGSSLFVGGNMALVDGQASSNVGRYSCFEPATLNLGLPETARTGERVEMTVSFDHGGRGLAGTRFVLDYDETCLEPDLDGDGELDEVQIYVDEAHATSMVFDAGLTNGELYFSVSDLQSPIALLPAGTLLTVGYEVVCEAGTTDFMETEIRFADDPAPSFTTDVGQNAGGETSEDQLIVWANSLLFADGFESGSPDAWAEVIVKPENPFLSKGESMRGTNKQRDIRRAETYLLSPG